MNRGQLVTIIVGATYRGLVSGAEITVKRIDTDERGHEVVVYTDARGHVHTYGRRVFEHCALEKI